MTSTLLFEYQYMPTGGDVIEVIEVERGDADGLRRAADRAMEMAASNAEFTITYRPAVPVTAFSSEGTAVHFGIDGMVR